MGFIRTFFIEFLMILMKTYALFLLLSSEFKIFIQIFFHPYFILLFLHFCKFKIKTTEV